jgi:hypothetical protein
VRSAAILTHRTRKEVQRQGVTEHLGRASVIAEQVDRLRGHLQRVSAGLALDLGAAPARRLAQRPAEPRHVAI